MSTALNRLCYDSCAYQKSLSQSVAPIDYILDISKYKNCGECRNELGLVGGPNVSHISGNLVDLENELFNITRPATRCPMYHYRRPENPGEPIRTPIDMSIPGRTPNPDVSTVPLHLQSCQFASYPEVPQPPMPQSFSCTSANSCP